MFIKEGKILKYTYINFHPRNYNSKRFCNACRPDGIRLCITLSAFYSLSFFRDQCKESFKTYKECPPARFDLSERKQFVSSKRFCIHDKRNKKSPYSLQVVVCTEQFIEFRPVIHGMSLETALHLVSSNI